MVLEETGQQRTGTGDTWVTWALETGSGTAPKNHVLQTGTSSGQTRVIFSHFHASPVPLCLQLLWGCLLRLVPPALVYIHCFQCPREVNGLCSGASGQEKELSWL